MSRIILCCVIGLLVLTAGCSRSADMTVGSKAFTESVVLAEICATLAEQDGANVRHVRELGGTRVMWDALRAGEIDVYPEYTGTIEQEIYQGQSFASQDELKAALQRDGIVMSESLGFNNTYALGMRRDRARELGIETISDLREHPDLRLGFSNEFLDRGDGWPSVRAAYQLPQQKVTGLEHTLAYEALRNGGLDIIDLYATDPQIVADDLLVLTDDLKHFPQYDAVLLFRKDFANRKPALTRALLQLDGTISEQRMAELNRQVQLDRKSEHNVAAAFVHEQFGYETTRETSTLSSRLATTTAQHLWLVSISLLAAIVVAIPAGVISARNRLAGQLILGFTEIVQTIPGLALLVLIGILFVHVGLPMVSPWPVIVALFLYSLLPIVRNTLAGLDGIPTSLQESAAVLGLTEWNRLWRIELPLASPYILTGIKTTAVINVGYAALGGLIGAGGYGQPIMTGLRLNNTQLMLEGAIPAAVLALVVKFLFIGLERFVVPRGLRLSA
ncbi:MAG: amino acid ABC transporter permease [Planctomyces sp.]|nr:amino acid ABC transporter permease [Planctomyces sp.]